MKCVITGVETPIKWKNIPICKNALIQAKEFISRKPKLTMKDALLLVDKTFQGAVNKRVEEHHNKEIFKETGIHLVGE